MWKIKTKRKENTVEDPEEAEINLINNTRIAQQQHGKECCSEILQDKTKMSKRNCMRCCKNYFSINVI